MHATACPTRTVLLFASIFVRRSEPNRIEAKLAPNDFLLFFTDGVIEVDDKEGRDFGIERLRQSVRSHLDQPTESLLEAIISDVYKFADSTVLIDDACLVERKHVTMAARYNAKLA